LVSPTDIHTPPEDRSCLVTTNRAPAVPMNLMKDIIQRKVKAKVEVE
jgi:hypothetical protein